MANKRDRSTPILKNFALNGYGKHVFLQSEP